MSCVRIAALSFVSAVSFAVLLVFSGTTCFVSSASSTAVGRSPAIGAFPVSTNSTALWMMTPPKPYPINTMGTRFPDGSVRAC